jgi:hypothetical protein
MSNPADLNISGKSDPSNKDYFDITINPLKLVTDYNFQFQWVFEDKAITEKVGDNWSNVFKVSTISDSINKPQFRAIDLDYTGNTLLVSWSGKDFLGADYKNNLQRIDIYAKGGSFGSAYKVVGQFTKSGTQTITASAAQYYVKLQAVSNSGGVSLFSDEQTIITESPLIVDLTPPDNPTDVGVTTGVDPKDQTGFSAFAKFSWTHHPNAATNGTRAYRLRWTYDTVNPVYEYGLVNYPNNSYTATGLIPNVEYTYQVASVDQFNNTKEYYTGGTFTASDPTNPDGWARLKSYISIGGATGDLFKFGTGIPTSINTSLTTTPSLTSGNYNGIILNKTGNNNNYWLTTGQLRVGGDTQFMYWDGTNLSITGDLGVGGGATVAGHLFMKTAGASIYSGTIVNDTLPSGTAGFVLNNSGLLVQNNEAGSNRKYVRLDPATGTLFANNAQITGTLIITGGATKTAIDTAAQDAADAKAAAEDAADSATAASNLAATKSKTTYSGTAPNNPVNGDIWFDTTVNYWKVYNNGWTRAKDADITAVETSLSGKLDTNQYSKSEIIKKINANANGAGIEGSVIFGSAIISNNVAAGDRGIRGATFTSAGSIFDLDNGTISTPNFRINSSGSAFFKGAIESGSTITGTTFSTAGNGNGSIKINGSNNQIEFIGDAGSIIGRALVYAGNQTILASGSGGDYFSYPTSAGMLGLSPQSVSLQVTNTSGVSIGGIVIDKDYATFSGLAVQNIFGAPIGANNNYFRNIGMGTGSKTTSDTDGYRGDIWIQYS